MMNSISQEQLYFEKLEEYLAFIEEYSPKILKFYKEQYYWKINIDGVIWDFFPHGAWVKMQRLWDNYEIDFDLLYDEKKNRYYFDKWKFHQFLENQRQYNFISINIFPDNFSERNKLYYKYHDYFINKNWIWEKQWLIWWFYISKIK